jgi:hypothetical protein
MDGSAPELQDVGRKGGGYFQYDRQTTERERRGEVRRGISEKYPRLAVCFAGLFSTLMFPGGSRHTRGGHVDEGKHLSVGHFGLFEEPEKGVLTAFLASGRSGKKLN